MLALTLIVRKQSKGCYQLSVVIVDSSAATYWKCCTKGLATKLTEAIRTNSPWALGILWHLSPLEWSLLLPTWLSGLGEQMLGKLSIPFTVTALRLWIWEFRTLLLVATERHGTMQGLMQEALYLPEMEPTISRWASWFGICWRRSTPSGYGKSLSLIRWMEIGRASTGVTGASTLMARQTGIML